MELVFILPSTDADVCRNFINTALFMDGNTGEIFRIDRTSSMHHIESGMLEVEWHCIYEVDDHAKDGVLPVTMERLLNARFVEFDYDDELGEVDGWHEGLELPEPEAVLLNVPNGACLYHNR